MATLVLGTVLNILIHFSGLIIAIMDSESLPAQISTVVEATWVITFLLYAAEGEEKVPKTIS